MSELSQAIGEFFEGTMLMIVLFSALVTVIVGLLTGKLISWIRGKLTSKALGQASELVKSFGNKRYEIEKAMKSWGELAKDFNFNPSELFQPKNKRRK